MSPGLNSQLIATHDKLGWTWCTAHGNDGKLIMRSRSLARQVNRASNPSRKILHTGRLYYDVVALGWQTTT